MSTPHNDDHRSQQRRTPAPWETAPATPEQERVLRPMRFDYAAWRRSIKIAGEQQAQWERESGKRARRYLRRRELPIVGRMLRARERRRWEKLDNASQAKWAKIAAEQTTRDEHGQLAGEFPDSGQESRWANYDDGLVAAWAADAMDRKRAYAVYGSNVEAPDAADEQAIAEWRRRQQAMTAAEIVDVQDRDERQRQEARDEKYAQLVEWVEAGESAWRRDCPDLYAQWEQETDPNVRRVLGERFERLEPVLDQMDLDELPLWDDEYAFALRNDPTIDQRAFDAAMAREEEAAEAYNEQLARTYERLRVDLERLATPLTDAQLADAREGRFTAQIVDNVGVIADAGEVRSAAAVEGDDLTVDPQPGDQTDQSRENKTPRFRTRRQLLQAELESWNALHETTWQARQELRDLAQNAEAYQEWVDYQELKRRAEAEGKIIRECDWCSVDYLADPNVPVESDEHYLNECRYSPEAADRADVLRQASFEREHQHITPESPGRYDWTDIVHFAGNVEGVFANPAARDLESRVRATEDEAREQQNPSILDDPTYQADAARLQRLVEAQNQLTQQYTQSVADEVSSRPDQPGRRLRARGPIDGSNDLIAYTAEGYDDLSSAQADARRVTDEIAPLWREGLAQYRKPQPETTQRDVDPDQRVIDRDHNAVQPREQLQVGDVLGGSVITFFDDGHPFGIDGPIELCPHCEETIDAQYAYGIDDMHEFCREEVEAEKAAQHRGNQEIGGDNDFDLGSKSLTRDDKTAGTTLETPENQGNHYQPRQPEKVAPADHEFIERGSKTPQQGQHRNEYRARTESETPTLTAYEATRSAHAGFGDQASPKNSLLDRRADAAASGGTLLLARDVRQLDAADIAADRREYSDDRMDAISALDVHLDDDAAIAADDRDQLAQQNRLREQAGEMAEELERTQRVLEGLDQRATADADTAAEQERDQQLARWHDNDQAAEDAAAEDECDVGLDDGRYR